MSFRFAKDFPLISGKSFASMKMACRDMRFTPMKVIVPLPRINDSAAFNPSFILPRSAAPG